MKTTIIVFFAIVIVSCTSNRIIPTGSGTYMISKKAEGCGLYSADVPKVALYADANDYCKEHKKEFEPIHLVAKDGVQLVRCASVELKFRCVAAREKIKNPDK